MAARHRQIGITARSAGKPPARRFFRILRSVEAAKAVKDAGIAETARAVRGA